MFYFSWKSEKEFSIVKELDIGIRHSQSQILVLHL